MSDDTNALETARRKKIMKYAALAGFVLSIFCNLLPARYQVACNAITQLANFTCTNGG